jgi:hypothetical protein
MTRRLDAEQIAAAGRLDAHGLRLTPRMRAAATRRRQRQDNLVQAHAIFLRLESPRRVRTLMLLGLAPRGELGVDGSRRPRVLLE